MPRVLVTWEGYNIVLYINEGKVKRLTINEDLEAIEGITRTDEYGYSRRLIDYLEKRSRSINIPIDYEATDFQRRVYEASLAIPYGETRSYKDIARASGSSRAYQAVGQALNKNPLPIIIPCHRVIGAGGSLVGYAYGRDLKSKLISMEREGI